MPHLENGPWLTLHLYRAQGGHDWFCPLCFNSIIVSHVVGAHTCTSLTAPMKWNLSLPLEYMHFGRDAAVCFCPKRLLVHQMAHSTSCSSFISSCTLKLDHIGTCTKYNLCVGGKGCVPVGCESMLSSLCLCKVPFFSKSSLAHRDNVLIVDFPPSSTSTHTDTVVWDLTFVYVPPTAAWMSTKAFLSFSLP